MNPIYDSSIRGGIIISGLLLLIYNIIHLHLLITIIINTI